MIEEIATVIAVNDGQVVVKSTIKSSCHSCHQQDECGSGQVAKAIPHKSLTTTLITKQSLNVGDEVVIGLSESSMLKSAIQVYLWPLIGLILSSAIGQLVFVEQFFWHELSALGFALIGGYLGYSLAKHQQSKPKIRNDLQPKLLRKCAKTISVTQI